MEDSRKGKRSRKKWLPTPNPYVDGGNGKKVIVYNTKREGKNEGGKKKRTTAKGKNLVPSVRILGHARGYFLYRYMLITLSFERYNPISLS